MVTVKQMSATQFQSQCLKALNEVAQTGEELIITKRGKPIAKLVPVRTQEDEIFGYMAGKVKIVGDIVGPVTPLEDWESR
jgi:prevent-host-death family protein